MVTYIVIFVILLALELLYFRVADYFNIIDKPNERSSHSTIVLRGGGIIFAISILVWMAWQMVNGEWCTVNDYLPFIAGLVLICGVSFWDDVHSLPDSVRLVAQFVAMGVTIGSILWQAEALQQFQDPLIAALVIFPIALVVYVGATNVINFMDGINGITAAYALAVLTPLAIMNRAFAYIEASFLAVAIIGVLVFCIFNFRPKGKAKCFAGDVGSIGIAFILLFVLGKLFAKTGDVTYSIFLILYAVDGCMTIIHRIMLHENLGQAHRKHAFQLMANELKIGHVKVSTFYMVLQLIVSLGFIYLCPDTITAHWIYFVCATLVLSMAYILFMMKYYHLHEAYLESLKIEH